MLFSPFLQFVSPEDRSVTLKGNHSVVCVRSEVTVVPNFLLIKSDWFRCTWEGGQSHCLNPATHVVLHRKPSVEAGMPPPLPRSHHCSRAVSSSLRWPSGLRERILTKHCIWPTEVGPIRLLTTAAHPHVADVRRIDLLSLTFEIFYKNWHI